MGKCTPCIWDTDSRPAQSSAAALGRICRRKTSGKRLLNNLKLYNHILSYSYNWQQQNEKPTITHETHGLLIFEQLIAKYANRIIVAILKPLHIGLNYAL